MKFEIEIADTLVEQIIRDTIANYPEAGAHGSLQCVKWHYPDAKPLSEWRFTFQDCDDGKLFKIGEAELKKAFELIFTDKWPKGCVQPPHSGDAEAWNEWLCNCDCESHDAFAQLACFGEVIYG